MKLLIVAAALLFAFAVPAGAQGYALVGTIVVTPPNPNPGDTIRVTVAQCDVAAATAVDVFIDGVLVGTAVPGPGGNFTAEFVVPDESQGEVMVQVFCDNGVLGSVINVQVADLPFQDGGSALPATGSNSTVPLVRVGVGLLGVGAMLVVAVGTKRDVYQAAHAGVNHG